ncbi:AMP-dependent synthetase [Paenibacillus sp. CFBP13512]|uniref:class I adenylate-forming enzyme family protein n=1 Tax=Paenibacillus sp. CFBP13512 TaxID=2184007 RepID=UPI0010BFC37F|nr:class I adenylate-forming enzyme family protein [Paenibacillus sp. CFBP13512]TKJ93371.1 AMP-dependent synthetase [Paenibacillus sp. CFBP13512]
MKRLCTLLENSAERDPYKAALITNEGNFTYKQLVEERDQIAAYMQTCGARAGDRIILLLPHCKFLVTSIFAASKLGLTFILLHESMTKYQLDYIIKDSQASYLLTNSNFFKKMNLSSDLGLYVILEDFIKNAEKNVFSQEQDNSVAEIACLLYTSGSTGRPKAIISYYSNIIFVLKSIQTCLEIKKNDVIGSFLPLSFDYGMYQIFLAFYKSATLALGQRTDIGPFMVRKLKQWNVTVLPIVPSIGEALIKLMHRQQLQLPKVRLITNTGATFPEIYIQKFKISFPNANLYLMYGLTECKRVSILQPEYLDVKPHSVGRPLPGTHCTIVDEKGIELPPYQVGELIVHGPHVMMGYWNDQKRTNQVFQNMNTATRSLCTGDYFWMDNEGFLYFYARKDDMYKQNGFRISPTEIELAAIDISGVEQAVLILVGTAKIPSLVVSSILNSENIREELKVRLEDYKIPEYIYIKNDLPFTINGKIDKNKLQMEITKEGEI